MENINLLKRYETNICCRKGCNELKYKKQPYCEFHSKEYRKEYNKKNKTLNSICCKKECNEPKHKKQSYCKVHSKEFYASYRRGKNIFAIKKDLDVGEDIPRGKVDYYIVYYIPSIHYCGITNSPYDRLYQHKHYNKKVDIKGWCVLQTCNNYLEALATEAEFHLMGMNGHIEMGRINYKT